MTTDDASREPADERTTSSSDEHAPEHEVLDPNGPCMACGTPNARIYASPDGPARLCPTCAALNGLGCP